jgi:hypothetical protein
MLAQKNGFLGRRGKLNQGTPRAAHLIAPRRTWELWLMKVDEIG